MQQHGCVRLAAGSNKETVKKINQSWQIPLLTTMSSAGHQQHHIQLFLSCDVSSRLVVLLP
jgi:imidazole glycerol phosphate synthase subunit HisF